MLFITSCTEMISAKKTNAEATKLVVESILYNRGLNTLTSMDKYESTQLSPSYLVGMSSSSMPMTGVPEAGVLMVLLIIWWIFWENSLSPSVYPILRELKSAVCAPQSRTATRGEGWAWCVRGCRAHHATLRGGGCLEEGFSTSR